jgi:2-polyprenyl-6-hydroxyphenyl methylase/3-demethylubiquinone-9 3-methyltransferase
MKSEVHVGARETSQHAVEVAQGERFEFGKNWSKFLSLLNERRIAEAEDSLKQMLECEDLNGKSFLDIGSGSGLFSLAARRLGARVQSFDYDPHSVACTAELRRRFFPEDESWTVESGSALDAEYVKALGAFDIVYSWGVLHHTGQMWRALDNARLPVAPGGKLFIAIYNDTGSQSTRWKWLKRTYNELPRFLRPPFALITVAPEELKNALRSAATLKFGDYVRSWTRYDQNRGMSHWRDIIDWVGGYPYEAAKPDAIFEFYRQRGFTLAKLKCGGGLGCNEFVFVREK